MPAKNSRSGEVPDKALIERIRAGDRDAFEVLYDRYFPRIYGFVDRRLRDSHDTEETVQEVFTNAFSAIHTYRGEAPFVAWLFGLTRRIIAARYRRRERPMLPLGAAEPTTSDFGSASHNQTPGPDEAYEYRLRVERMQHVIDEDLSEEQWQIFELHHLQRHSVRELARRFAKSEQAVKSHLYRVRKALLAR